jgi:hypothetical protein
MTAVTFFQKIVSPISKVLSGNWITHAFIIFSYIDFDNEGKEGKISFDFC